MYPRKVPHPSEVTFPTHPSVVIFPTDPPEVIFPPYPMYILEPDNRMLNIVYWETGIKEKGELVPCTPNLHLKILYRTYRTKLKGPVSLIILL
jgi:hypothetical protein